MDENVRIINEYYTNLEYNINDKKEALKIISDLYLELNIEDANNFAIRFSETAILIQDNFLLFASVCEHIDVVNSILDYLKYFSVQFMHDTNSEFKNKFFLIASLMTTIFNISLESEIQLFLENAIIKDSKVQYDEIYRRAKYLFSKQKIDVILLEESDLYAFYSYLKIKNVISSLNKIWVHVSIKKAFKWHIKKYFGHLSVPTYIFQSKQELFSVELFYMEFRIFSIWSEDIISARNLAMSLKGQVVFINTHMNFCASILLPYTKNLGPNFYFQDKSNYECLINLETDYNLFFNKYHLFYNGMWQKPITNTYWKYNDILLANATCEDVIRCMESAAQGFKIWSAKSINSRMHVLSQLALILEYKNESLLANIISKWLKLPYFYFNQLTRHDIEFKQQFEITEVRIPRGVILLEEKDKITMFRELTQSLITGNSIIVICNPDVCTLPSYCDMFSTAIIPPGVINFLSSKCMKHIEYDKLTALNPKEIYTYLTMNKYIIVCVK
ncbi:uncharacterized protein LOC126851557 [Cataglyphis hispanica]|uniref:uncharacterized protein LOC126851557 n=1 Tax=Cataglyphis hispanica TaxID=1086592 RepID=UPI0021804786|nr:uncharacterized protein LOC126851557 [Cataglyphis hispanica]